MAFNDDAKTPLTKEEREQEVIKYAVRMIAITIMVVFAFMSSCTMMPDFVDADAAKVQTAQADGQVKIAAQKHKEEMAKIAAIERLIKEHKVDPIAARCAVEGWDRTNEDVCKKIAGVESNVGKVSISVNSKQDK